LATGRWIAVYRPSGLDVDNPGDRAGLDRPAVPRHRPRGPLPRAAARSWLAHKAPPIFMHARRRFVRRGRGIDVVVLTLA